ncbi:mitochondrial potassium channel [Syngnathoides biaculeatus]|uniref:mitochondrial potassium channel n=1 Tax=Syngnathoides biaculeatus TaxID=300417 RepID=UPI002ADDBC24|nr:mitochondrial potassium channel [Syngnathoides biaculeatus]XP_061687514.1 mitochondrial potassium channel [Syngnathoides biaculeatus]XP_061687515.1 mitochondrial potassium channel [Syngnathoides biaculeatus]
MRYRVHGSGCWSRLFLLKLAPVRWRLVRSYSARHQAGGGPAGPIGPEGLKERALSALQHAGRLGQQWTQKSAQMAAATVNTWWEKYEEFVGLNEVRRAQTKVTEAESGFLVSRGMVREAHVSLEALQSRLKEVRARLDRVAREEAHYLELATLEHKLLQDERRLRTAHGDAEAAERETFAAFSAAVRESHEKERARAERTKNWSVIGSVLGALIGVMGSTYVNRVRLQELKSLLLEAQKGPESLQEALKVQASNHRSQLDELGALADNLRGGAVPEGRSPSRTDRLLETLLPRVSELQRGLGGVRDDLSRVTNLLENGSRSAEDVKTTASERLGRSTLYNAAFAYTAAALTVTAVYALLRGGA